MPPRPRLVKDEALEFPSWDQRVAEAQAAAVPYRVPISADETLEFPCPLGADLISLATAQSTQDLAGMATAVFGKQATRVLQLTADQPFVLLVKLVNDVMSFYNLRVNELPES